MNKLFIRRRSGLAAVALMILLVAPGAWPNSIATHSSGGSCAVMTAEEAAWLFFNACERRDWVEVERFWPMPVDDHLKKYAGGLEALRIGESFKSETGPGLFVPYKIRLRNGEVKKHRLSLRNDNSEGCWFVDGGL